MAGYVNTSDFKSLAHRRLPKMVFDYVAGGADEERGLSRNREAFERTTFAPRRFVDVSHRTTKTTVFGRDYRLPVYVSPTGLNGLLWPQGDAVLARAAANAGIPFALSTASNMSIEEIADISTGDLWFQLYVLHRNIAQEMCDRAKAAGYSTLILTIDVPVNGNRERDIRNGFSVPVAYTARTILDGIRHPAWSFELLRNGVPKLRNFETLQTNSLEAQAALMQRKMDASFDFDALKALRDSWSGCLIVKGVARDDDIKRCAEIGIDAVILSNHGGRQIDNAVPALATVADAVLATNIPVFVDGGVTRGSDIAKALCLGASMVGLGRVLLYALASKGEDGVSACLEILSTELDREQAMLGAPTIPDLTNELIQPDSRTARSSATQSTASVSSLVHLNAIQQEEKVQ